MRLRAFVFSFARGAWLANCVESVETLLPQARLTVIDDGSDDDETLAVLDDIARRHDVVSPGNDPTLHRLGGLYANMAFAFEALADDDLYLFLQDDMQIVRRVDDADLMRLARHCDAGGLVSPCFLKGINRDRGARYVADPTRPALLVRDDPGKGPGRHFAAVHLARAGALRAAGWHFESGEPRNEAAAVARGLPRLGYPAAPFAMYLPFVPAHRHRLRTRALATATRRGRLGLYPFLPMSETKRARLAVNGVEGPSEPAFAEDWLDTATPAPATPWVYGPFEGRRWLKHLHRLEVELRGKLRAA